MLSKEMKKKFFRIISKKKGFRVRVLIVAAEKIPAQNIKTVGEEGLSVHAF